MKGYGQGGGVHAQVWGLALFTLSTVTSACSSSSTTPTDGGSTADAAPSDSATKHDGGTHSDAKAPVDGGVEETGVHDTGTPNDAPTHPDAVSKDAAPKDAGAGDASQEDAGIDGGSLPDSGLGDSGVVYNCMGVFDCPPTPTACLVWMCIGAPGICQESYAASGTGCTDHGGTSCDSHGDCK